MWFTLTAIDNLFHASLIVVHFYHYLNKQIKFETIFQKLLKFQVCRQCQVSFRNAQQGFGTQFTGNPIGERRIGKPMHSWEDSVRMQAYSYIGKKNDTANWIYSAQKMIIGELFECCIESSGSLSHGVIQCYFNCFKKLVHQLFV